MRAARILIVDDDPVSLRTFRGLLQPEGYTLVEVNSGQGALELLQTDVAVDLVILDVVLPDLDGISICRRLKRDARTEHIPIILVSAIRKDDTSIREGLSAGAEGYLLKPIEDVALRAWVKATLRINALQRELAARHAKEVESLEEVLKAFVKLSHTVNKPLQALYANMDMLMLSRPRDDKTNALTVEVLHHAEHVAQLVAQASLQAKALLAALPPRSSEPEAS
jgi:CheY-like chemotaxis protein